MFKLLKAVVLVISAISFIPAYAQEAPKADAPKQEPAKQAAPAPEGLKLEAPKQEALKPESSKPDSPKPDSPKPSAKELVKGLDEQVQEIKTDVLSIAAQLNQLEEKLIYPSDTQVAVFVSLAKGDKFRLDAVDIGLDGTSVAHHLYTFKELEALQKGGVQRIFVGNLRTGEHALQVTVSGKSEGGSDFQKGESFKIAKNVGPKLVGVVLTGNGGKTITVKDW